MGNVWPEYALTRTHFRFSSAIPLIEFIRFSSLNWRNYARIGASRPCRAMAKYFRTQSLMTLWLFGFRWEAQHEGSKTEQTATGGIKVDRRCPSFPRGTKCFVRQGVLISWSHTC